jgi:hypothetical protein
MDYRQKLDEFDRLCVKSVDGFSDYNESCYDAIREDLLSQLDAVDRLRVQLKIAKAALEEIKKGAFSRDPLTYASSTIESMINIAFRALKKLEADE